jgi:uncharacterized RDD family membrane protein YckC/cytoskeletal protein CcmA (bactofilin family)
MKPISKAPLFGLLLAALAPFSLGAYQADPAKSGSDAPTPTPQVSAANPAAAPLPDAAAATAARTAAPAAPETPLHEIAASPAAPTEPPARYKSAEHRANEDDNRVTFNDENIIQANDNVSGNAVAIMAPLSVAGRVEGNAVAVTGRVKIDGIVDGNAVAVLGRNTVNGTVHGNAVAVMGNLTLGPGARVDGNAVSVGGRVVRDPSAVVGGNVVPINFGADASDDGAAASYWRHGLRLGRPMAFGPHLHVFWLMNLFVIALYLLLTLLFPNGIRKCADTLAHRPGITFLTGFLAILGLPVLMILLCVTVVGIPVAFVVVPLGILACLLFGKAAIYAFVGRSILGKQAHVTLSALLGVGIVMAFYLIPALGLALFFLISFLGFSCALTTLFTSSKPAAAPATPPALPPQPGTGAAIPPSLAVPPVAAVPVAGLASEGAPAPAAVPLDVAAAPAVAAPVSLPPSLAALSEAGYPKAGFWIRMLALLIDVIVIALVAHSHDEWVLPGLALYGAVLWKLKGSTLGGIICALKVVRHDGRPMDWATAIVRALGCFLSLLFIGLGFFWIAFDSEKQGWHDKIAGTIVVRLPKGVSLV